MLQENLDATKYAQPKKSGLSTVSSSSRLVFMIDDEPHNVTNLSRSECLGTTAASFPTNILQPNYQSGHVSTHVVADDQAS